MPDSAAFNPLPLIIAKRDGEALEPAQIRALVDAYTAGDVPDYQMAAFLMASFLRGMDDAEAQSLADAMLHSGDVLDLSEIPGTKVDKHSTGGVSDNVSLVLAPLVAACGVPVPMISGRGLGHTGGTLDKLASIPGFRTDLSIDEYRQHLAERGVVMLGQTEEVAPADRKLYALRDVTGTVDFIPFIAASIMSKKLAAGLDALVLDVKCGGGAFMQREADARKLAETLVAIGERAGTPTVAHLTRMDAPLGLAIGNWVEVEEALACLRGEDVLGLTEVTLALAGTMLRLGGAAETDAEGRALAERAIADGSAMEKFREMVRGQDGDASVLDAPETRPGRDPVAEVTARQGGVITHLDARALGLLAVDMGAGRRAKEDEVDPVGGIVLAGHLGDRIEAGQPLATLHTQRTGRLDEFTARLREAITFGEEAPAAQPWLMDRYENGTWHGPA